MKVQSARSVCKRVKVAEADLLAHLSSSECSAPRTSCLFSHSFTLIITAVDTVCAFLLWMDRLLQSISLCLSFEMEILFSKRIESPTQCTILDLVFGEKSAKSAANQNSIVYSGGLATGVIALLKYMFQR